MGTEEAADGTTTRHRIRQIALALMSQRGVDGTSMRDLASAAGLNVASLYHYFPSKRELLESVLVEHGYLPIRSDWPMPSPDPSIEVQLADWLTDMLTAMFQVEDFIRLMVGEAIRYEETARAVGFDLFTDFQTSIELWIVQHWPDLHARLGAGAVARLLSAMVVGIFVERAAGVMGSDGEDLNGLVRQRAGEAAKILAATG
ncbi:MAG TPA: helix-turn-helix domain-containing protein [Acidimicrobiales bacterium]|nr:helix-turn-helix domain-containing protein [Acidimicrobiales bacterium]